MNVSFRQKLPVTTYRGNGSKVPKYVDRVSAAVDQLKTSKAFDVNFGFHSKPTFGSCNQARLPGLKPTMVGWKVRQSRLWRRRDQPLVWGGENLVFKGRRGAIRGCRLKLRWGTTTS